jgi:hypothetical protein
MFRPTTSAWHAKFDWKASEGGVTPTSNNANILRDNKARFSFFGNKLSRQMLRDPGITHHASRIHK